MDSVFREKGTLLELKADKPLLLKDEHLVWRIDSGAVDIFSVQIENGDVIGARHHLLRAEAGQLVFGIASQAEKKQLGLIAVGTAGLSRLLQLDLSYVKELVRDVTFSQSFNAALDQWISGLSTGVCKAMFPNDCKALEPGKEIPAGENESVCPKKGTLWVQHIQGSSLFMGRDELLPLIQNEFIPVSDKAWLTCKEKSLFTCMDHEAFFRQDSSWKFLHKFHALILDCIFENLKQITEIERRRLQEQKERDRFVFSNALRSFTSLLETKKTAAPVGKDEGNPLLSACYLIGAALAIEIIPPVGMSNDQVSQDLLDDIARASRIRVRQVILRDDWWRRENGPLLAFKEENKQPVALLQKSPRQYELNDPVKGTQVKVTSEVAADFGPIAFTFYRPFPERILNAKDLLQFGFRGCINDVGIVILMGVLGALLGLITPFATGILFDSVIPEAAHGQLVQIIAILLTCALATSMFEITKGIALLRLETKLDISLQSALCDRLMSLPVSFFRDYSSGDLAHRSLGINSIREILSGVTVTALLAVIFSTFNFGLMFYYDWRLALVSTGLGMIAIFCTSGASYLQVRYQRRVSEIQGEIAGNVLQFITGISKFRISGTENRAFSAWAGKFVTQKQIAFKSETVNNVLATFNASFPVLASMALFAWLILGSTEGMSTGEFLAFNVAFTTFQNALLQMSVSLTASLNVIPLYERMTPIIQTLPEVDEAKAHPGRLEGKIEINNVRFRYIPEGPFVLNDVSLSVKPGEFVALVGGSGSGKSTLFRILLGFETPDSGTVYYDGQDFATLDVREVRRQIGVVLQNGRLMAGDIYRNIVGNSTLTIDDAWAAARMAGLDEDIKQMPMGMNTVLSAGGGTLSGGQRQRLLIARAVVNKPRILFFDEATSALDNRTQATVGRSLENLQATRIVIAHRLSTISGADRIFVMDKGLIVQGGSYAELIGQEGLFAQLVNRQIA